MGKRKACKRILVGVLIFIMIFRMFGSYLTPVLAEKENETAVSENSDIMTENADNLGTGTSGQEADVSTQEQPETIEVSTTSAKAASAKASDSEDSDVQAPAGLEEESSIVAAGLSQTDDMRAAESSSSLLDNTTVDLDKITLKVTYIDEDGNKRVEELSTETDAVFPYNATINMRLDFLLGDGNAITPGTEYVYVLPENIRVDVEETLALKDNNGTELGTVHVSKEGTLTFVFNDSISNQTAVPFFVAFSGGLSDDLQKEGQQTTIQFPTASGSFDYEITTTERNDDDEEKEPGDIIIKKYGSRIICDGKQNYIKWTVELGANGRSEINGVLTDHLPDGLTYAEVDGYPKVEGLKWGNDGTATTTAKEGDSDITIVVSGCTPDYRVRISFCTYYGDDFDASGNLTYDNTAVFDPDDGIGVSDTGTVAFQPQMVKKSGSEINLDDQVITWTVLINEENLNIAGATYQDTIGEGHILNGDVKIEKVGADGTTEPAELTANVKSDNGSFKVVFPNNPSPNQNTYKITYQTKIQDGNLAQKTFENTGTLNVNDREYSDTGSVKGLNLIEKDDGIINKITNTITWKIHVNKEGIELEDVVVTDTFSSTQMEYVSADAELDNNQSDIGNGKLVFSLGRLTSEKIITVVTKIKNPESFDGQYLSFRNTAEMKSNINDSPVSDDGWCWTQITKPNLIDKSGTIQNGVISWTVTVNPQAMETKKFVFSDILPEGTEYVDGSFFLYMRWYDPSPLYCTPKVIESDGQTVLSYELDMEKEEERSYTEAQFGFLICYDTRVTDLDKATVESTYTNKAKVKVTYEDNQVVEDEEQATVTGEVGGLIKKGFEYDQNAGWSYIYWDVVINEAGNDLSDITNPLITDQLADFLQYDSGALYKLQDGVETEILKSEYIVTVINNKLTVQLPNIGKNTYVFRFKTNITCFADEWPKDGLVNTVSFEGKGKNYSEESANLQNVNFSTVAAGIYVKREIRVKKVDSVTNEPLANAVFRLYVGNLYVGEAVSDDQGIATFENMGSLTGYELCLEEILTPDGYKKYVPDSADEKDGYTIKTDGSVVITGYTEDKLTVDNGVSYYEVVIPNEKLSEESPTGQIDILKEDKDTRNPLSGAVFGLYSDEACVTLIAKRTTGTDGKVSFNELAIDALSNQSVYYLKEITPPKGYVSDTAVIKVTIEKQTDGSVKVIYKKDGEAETPLNSGDYYTISNIRAVGVLTLTKVDADEPNTKINGTTFILYKDSQCTDIVAKGTTGDNGVVSFSGLELGRTYYYKETAANADYVLDSTVHSVVIGNGTETENIPLPLTVTNEKKLGNIVITKKDDSVPAKLLSGVKFQLYQEDGTIPYQISGNGGLVDYIVTTDEEGKAVFENLPFGTYVVKEINGKSGYQAAADTTVTVNKLGDTDVTIINRKIKCSIVVTKVDQDDHVLAGATIVLRSNAGAKIASAVSGEDGKVTFENIPYSENGYYIVEEAAPDGYIRDTIKHPITSDEINDAFSTDSKIVRKIVNKKESGAILFQKKGKESNSNDPYPLEGAIFTLFDEHMLFVKTATSMTEGEAALGVAGVQKGSVYFNDLSYGTYYVQETTAPQNYIRDDTIYKVVVNRQETEGVITMYTKDDNTTENFIVTNEKMPLVVPLICFKVKKTDESGNALANATFELLKNNVKTGITAVTDENGIAYFRQISISADSIGTKYTVKETKAPGGYLLNDTQVLTVGIKEEPDENGNSPAINMYFDNENNPKEPDEICFVGQNDGLGSDTNATVINEQIKGNISVIKKDVSTKAVLMGAEFTLYKDAAATQKFELNTLKNPAKTGADGVVVFNDLPYGTYYIKETKAPNGYALNSSITKAVITDNGQTVSVNYSDTRLSLSISKQAVGGTDEIPGAKLEIREQGQTDVHYSFTTANIVKTIPSHFLTAGKTYVLSETEAPKGYGYFEDVTFTVNENGSITVTEGAEKSGNAIIVRDKPVSLSILKTNDESPAAPLPGAIFTVLDQNEKELYRFTSTDSEYQIPLGILQAPKDGINKYIIREISAPEGYEVAADIWLSVDRTGKIALTTAIAAGTYDAVQGLLTIPDKKKPNNALYVRKLDVDTLYDIKGAEFAVYKEDAPDNPVESWESDGKPHKLGSGVMSSGSDYQLDTVYILRETRAPEGYLTAADIRFKIVVEEGRHRLNILSGNADNINGDKDTLLVRDRLITLIIRKQNDYGTILKGAKLQLWKCDSNGTITEEQPVDEFISDGRNPYVVSPEKLTVGTEENPRYYVLKETDPPEGYDVADDIIFSIAFNGVIARKDGVRVVNDTIIMEDADAVTFGKISAEEGKGLAGSTLRLTSLDDNHFEEKEWVSDGTRQPFDLLNFRPGYTYVLTEINAPDGYAYADPIIFKIEGDDYQVYINGEIAENRTVYIADGRLVLNVSKKDTGTGVEISGAEFAVLDENGNTVTTFTTNGAVCSVDTSVLQAGVGDIYKEYILRETKAPYGYRPAEDICFAIDKDGKVYLVTTDILGNKKYTLADNNLLTVYDEPLISVLKVNEKGKAVADATLTITAKRDDSFTPITFTTTKEPYYFTDGTFKPGIVYTLSESRVPDGYAAADSIRFTIDKKGNVYVNDAKMENNRIQMVDKALEVVIAKRVAGTNELLAGATLAIKDESGKVIHSFVTKNKAVTLPSKLFKSPKDGEMSYYTLSEIAAPDGYLAAEDIAFAIDQKGVVYVRNANGKYKKAKKNRIDMYDAASSAAPPNTATETNKTYISPKTGDDMPLAVLFGLMLGGLAGCVTGCMILIKKRRKRSVLERSIRG